MTQYIVRRSLQAIPLLFIISVILFLLMSNMGDPLATLGGRQPPRGADRQRLERQMGLDQPIYLQYVYWLVGNDWRKVDTNGDGEPDTNGTRRGILRGDWGTSLVTRRPVLEMIWERLPNTLLLMGTVEVLVILIALGIGIYSALRQYSKRITSDQLSPLWLFHAHILGSAHADVHLRRQLARWGLPYFPTVGMYDPAVGKTASQVIWHMVSGHFSDHLCCRLAATSGRACWKSSTRLYPHRPQQGVEQSVYPLGTRLRMRPCPWLR